MRPSIVLSSLVTKVGRERSLGGTSEKTMRPGTLVSMRSPICSTTPSATLSTLASCTTSSPLSGSMTDHADHAADGFLQQLLRRQQIEVEILLQHVERAGARFQQRGLGPDLGADIDEGDVVLALDQGDRARIAHQRQILVVDGDGDAGLVGQGRIGFARHGGGCHGQGQQAGGGERKSTHGNSPLEMWY